VLARVSGSAGEYFSLGAQARHQRVDRVAARLDAGHGGRRDGAHVPVVRAAYMTAQELAAALKLAPRHPAVGAALPALPGCSWRLGNLGELRVPGPTESPQVRFRGAVPHRIPTDETAFPGTRRHGC
jgi:hypothetical protein